MLEHVVLVLFVIATLVKVVHKLTMKRCTSSKCLVGKTAVVTGGISGIGLETAKDLAKRGCKVILADVNEGSEICRQIALETENFDVKYMHLDLASFKSVRNFCEKFLQHETRLDILIHNAACINKKEVTTVDGLSKILQVNCLSPFLISHLFADILRKTKQSKIVYVSSITVFLHQLSANILDTPKIKNTLLYCLVDYSNSKILGTILAKMMGDILKRDEVYCFSVHPGVVDTTIAKDVSTASGLPDCVAKLFYTLAKYFFKSPEQAAQTTLHCALSTDLQEYSGCFFSNCSLFWQPSILKNQKFCHYVWEECERLVKLKENEKMF